MRRYFSPLYLAQLLRDLNIEVVAVLGSAEEEFVLAMECDNELMPNAIMS
jgi:hypothetical protein